MHSLLRGNGVRIKIIQSDSTRCEIYGKRSDTGDEYTSLYTIEDAKKANLVKSGGSWEKNPSDMLFARCISRLRRRLAPDIATKAYVEGELEDAEVDMTAAPSPSQPSEEEITAQFKEKFKSIENMDYDLEEFVKFTSEKGKKSTIETIKSALNQVEKFTAAYLKWVASKEPVQEVSAVVETKEMTLV